MLALERQQQILTILEEKGTVRTIDLAEEFQVTDETIRRDLQTLAVTHRIARIHGGASSLTGRPKLQSFVERRAINVGRKKAIANAALDFIEAGKTYAFDSSTTIFEMVCILPDIPFRVLTNAYSVLDQLIRFEQIDLICSGGRYHSKTQTFGGAESIGSLRRHNVNIAFLSCVGLDINQGASEAFEEQAGFKENLVAQAERVVLLADSSKLARRSEYFFASLNNIDVLITDSGAKPDLVDTLRESGCEVIVAPFAE